MLRNFEIAKVIVEHRRQEAIGDPQAVIASATIAIVSVIAALVGAGVGAYSASATAEAQKKSAEFNAAVATNNAQSATQQAQYQADRIRAHNRAIMGSARADLAKSGVSITSGSAQDIMTDSSIQGELDRSAAIYTGRVTAGNQSSAAQLDRARGAFAGTAGAIGVGSSILGGVSNATTIYSNPNFRNGAID